MTGTNPTKETPLTGAATLDADPPDALRQLGRSFKRAMAAVRRLRGRETRRPGELSDAQYGLLFGLRDQAELSTSELAISADLSPATTTEMLEALEAAGLVRRARSQRDRRVVLTSLTERGHALVAERHARYEPLWRAAFEEFSEDEIRSAAAVLERMAEMFDELNESRPEPPET